MTRSSRGSKSVFGALLPEKQIIIQTAHGARSLHLSPGTQFLACAGAVLTLGWLALASATIIVDRIAPDAAPGSTLISQSAFENRLHALTDERDQRAAEALSAQNRFQTAMEQISRHQTALLQTIEERRELESALDLTRARLAEALDQRDTMAVTNDRLVAEMNQAAVSLETSASGADLTATLEAVTGALKTAVVARDTAAADRERLTADLEDAELRLDMARLRHEQVMAEVRTAVATSSGPLEDLLRKADLDVDSTLALVRRDYSGQGGPLVPLGVSTRSYEPDIPSSSQFDELMLDVDRLNFLRLAVGKVPYAVPVKASHRFTSGFGYRRDPKGRGRRMHTGVDFAAPKGTPIHATADGVVVSAKSESGYGKTIRIRHDFGYETVYAHQSRLLVESGQRVSRGDVIGAMGSTGRSTGVHLHYEVHVNGRPVNPMTYLEAAKDVF